MRHFSPRAVVVLLAVLGLSPPAAAVPSAETDDLDGARGLLSDLARIVAGQESEGWFSDAIAFRDIEAHLLESVCRATPAARTAAHLGLKKARAAAGDPRALFATKGELTAEVAEALNVDRQLRALELALSRTAGECPFWLPPERGFKGRQTDRDRLTLSLETGGNVQFRYTEGSLNFGGGGLARFLPGYGFPNGQVTLLAGIEFGGGAMVRPDTSASQFIINYFPAIPVVLRTHHETFHWDLEAAGVALFQADNTTPSYGGRFGGAFAFTALRRRNILPWAGLALAYEHYLPGAGRERMHFVRGGLRVGLQWDP